MCTLRSCIMIPSFSFVENFPVPNVYISVMDMYELNTINLLLQSESIMITDYSSIMNENKEEQCNLQL